VTFHLDDASARRDDRVMTTNPTRRDFVLTAAAMSALPMASRRAAGAPVQDAAEEITAETIAHAECLAGIAFTDEEREMIAGVFGISGDGAKRTQRTPSRLANLAFEYGHEQQGRVSPVLRDEIARLDMDERAFKLTMQRSRDAAKAGHAPGSESSIFKIYGTELNKDRYELMVRMAGPDALGWEGPGFDAGDLDPRPRGDPDLEIGVGNRVCWHLKPLGSRYPSTIPPPRRADIARSR